MRKPGKEKYIYQKKHNGNIYFVVRFKYGNGKIYSKSFNSADYQPTEEMTSIGAAKAAAIVCRDTMRVRYAKGLLGHADDIHLSVLMEHKKNVIMRSLRTNKTHQSIFKVHIKNVIGDPTIRSVTVTMIEHTMNVMIDDYTDDQIKRVFTLWKELYHTAIKENIVDRDLTIDADIPSSNYAGNPRNVTLSTAELSSVIEAAAAYKCRTERSQYNRDRLIDLIKVMYYTGIRPSEAFAIRRQDIDFKNRFLSICSKVGSNSTELITIKKTKTNFSYRKVPFPAAAVRVFKDALESNSNEYIFSDYNGKLFNIDYITNLVSTICKKNGLDFRLYNLRHQYATDLVTKVGADGRTIMELMGHVEFSTSIGYARSDDQLKKQAINDRQKRVKVRKSAKSKNA